MGEVSTGQAGCWQSQGLARSATKYYNWFRPFLLFSVKVASLGAGFWEETAWSALKGSLPLHGFSPLTQVEDLQGSH